MLIELVILILFMILVCLILLVIQIKMLARLICSYINWILVTTEGIENGCPAWEETKWKF